MILLFTVLVDIAVDNLSVFIGGSLLGGLGLVMVAETEGKSLGLIMVLVAVLAILIA